MNACLSKWETLKTEFFTHIQLCAFKTWISQTYIYNYLKNHWFVKVNLYNKLLFLYVIEILQDFNVDFIIIMTQFRNQPMAWRLAHTNIIHGRVISSGGIPLVNHIIRENSLPLPGVHGRETTDRSPPCFIHVALRVCYICNRSIFHTSFMSTSKSVKIC